MRPGTLLAITSIALSAQAASADELYKHTSNETEGDTVVNITETVSDGRNVRIDIYNADAVATSSGMAGGGNVKVSYKKGALDSTIVYNAAADTVYMFDGRRCQALGKDSPPPPGMPQGGVGDMQAMMQQAMADAAKDNPELAKIMRDNPNLIPGMQTMQPRGELKLVKKNEPQRIGDWRTERVDAVDSLSGETKHVLRVAPVASVAGGRQMYDGMLRMYGAIEAYTTKIGGKGLMGPGLTPATLRELEGSYPIVIEHPDGEASRLADAQRVDSADFDVSCN